MRSERTRPTPATTKSGGTEASEPGVGLPKRSRSTIVSSVLGVAFVACGVLHIPQVRQAQRERANR